ncbi:MAG: hypothetical protein H0Z39_03820 [Peptococcaceae bacterium]|nr:hypothetical protein [Peptococcaceae bacterium]
MDKKVRDIMKPLTQFPWVGIRDNMFKVVQQLYASRKEGNNSGCAVVEDGGVPVGLISIRGVFDAMEPGAFHISLWSVPVFWEGLWEERIRHLKRKMVSEFVAPKEMIGVQNDHNLMRVVYVFNRTKIPAVAVMDGNRMVGIVEAAQVFREILRDAAELGSKQ